MVVADQEIMRTKTILQLQYAADESLEIGDMRAVISAVREMAKIAGIADAKEDEYNEEMVKAIRKFSTFTPEAPLPPEHVIQARAAQIEE